MPLPVSTGESASVSKTLTETDLAFFAAISGDFDPVHMDEEYARSTRFGRRIAHGVLSMALLSTVAAKISALARGRGFVGTPVSLGYDRIRFLHPVFVGDTLRATYTVETLEEERARSRSKVEVHNQAGELCVAGQHIMKWLA